MLGDAFGVLRHNFKESKEFRKSSLGTLEEPGIELLMLRSRQVQRATIKLSRSVMTLKLFPIQVRVMLLRTTRHLLRCPRPYSKGWSGRGYWISILVSNILLES